MGEQIKNNILDIEGITLSPLKIIEVEGGNVLHGLKSIESSFYGFGEAYFSTIAFGTVKAWKRHTEMVLNLIVPSGNIRFVLFDDRKESQSYRTFGEVSLSIDNYYRLTVPPMLWMGFQGLANQNSMLLNIANISHRPDEVDRKAIHEINYDWEIK
jgi:dTDP-4-dehydrorhamnose 3,5-epimerase